MISFLATILSILGLLMSCKSTLQDSSTLDAGQSWEVKKLESPLIVFNWSNQSGDLNDHLSAQIDLALKMNSDIANGKAKAPPLAAMGMGLYFANDPILSVAFGNELSCIEIKKNSEILKAKGQFLGDLEIETALTRTEPLLIYGFGLGLIPFMDGGASSGVIRDKSVVDYRKSIKIAFSKPKAENFDPNPANHSEFSNVKLDSRSLSRASASLNSGKFCEAFKIFENNLPALFYSSIAGVKAFLPPPNADMEGTYLGSRSLILGLRHEITERANSLFESKEIYAELRKELIELDILEKDRIKNQDLEKFTFASILYEALSTSKFDRMDQKKITALTRLVNLSQVISIPTGAKNVEEFSKQLQEGFDQKIAKWSQVNKDDFEFAKKLWKYWNEHSISNFITRK